MARNVTAGCCGLALLDIGRDDEGIITRVLTRLEERARARFGWMFDKAIRARQVVTSRIDAPNHEAVAR